MAIFPKAKYRPVSGLEKDPPIKAIGVILHVTGDTAGSPYNYFNGPSGGIESHFFISTEGEVEQYRDTDREADANYHGNSFIRNGDRLGFLSIETEGEAPGFWNNLQLTRIKELLLWLNKAEGIPLVECPAWDKPGIGYHIMWGSPGEWTPKAKSCPGPNRIKQFKEVIVPWLKSNPTGNEDDVELTDKFAVYNPQDGSRPTITVQEALRRASYVYNFMPILKSEIAEVKAQNVAVLAALQASNKGLDPDQINAAVAEAMRNFRLTLGPVDDEPPAIPTQITTNNPDTSEN